MLGERSAGNRHATFEEAGAGNTVLKRTGAPALDPTKQHRYAIGRNYNISKDRDDIFVQNAELHTHGFNAPDLSLGPYRNAVILKELTGYDYGITSKKNVFQDFGVPKRKVAGKPCVPIH